MFKDKSGRSIELFVDDILDAIKHIRVVVWATVKENIPLLKKEIRKIKKSL